MQLVSHDDAILFSILQYKKSTQTYLLPLQTSIFHEDMECNSDFFPFQAIPPNNNLMCFATLFSFFLFFS